MELKQAKELAKLELEKAPIVVVTSDKAVYLLNEVAEISVVEAHATRNKLQSFVVKNSFDKEVKAVEVEETEPTEKKDKKKK